MRQRQFRTNFDLWTDEYSAVTGVGIFNATEYKIIGNPALAVKL